VLIILKLLLMNKIGVKIVSIKVVLIYHKQKVVD
jgi:hypothetical protein